MILDAEQFMKQIGRQTPQPIILFAPGKPPSINKEDFEPYLVDRAIEAIIAAYVDPSMRDLTYTSVYAEETAPGEIAEEASTLPFLAERRVILVRNAEKYSLMSDDKRSLLTPLLDYIKNPSNTTILMFIASSIDKRRRFYKSCEGSGVVVECPQLSDARLADWIRKEVQKRERAISPDGVQALIEKAGGRLADQANEIVLVCNFVEQGATIREEQVQAACADVAETTIWALTDAIAASNTSAALGALHELVAMNKVPDEIIGTINWLLESAYRTLPETQATLKSSFVARKVGPLGRKFGLNKLVAAMALCTRTQFSLRTTGADKQLLLEMLVIKLSAAGAARDAAQKRAANT